MEVDEQLWMPCYIRIFAAYILAAIIYLLGKQSHQKTIIAIAYLVFNNFRNIRHTILKRGSTLWDGYLINRGGGRGC